MKIVEIRAFRESQGITQEELAEKAKISRETIIKIETGSGSVYQKTFNALCKGLGINPDDVEGVNIYDGRKKWKDRVRKKHGT